MTVYDLPQRQLNCWGLCPNPGAQPPDLVKQLRWGEAATAHQAAEPGAISKRRQAAADQKRRQAAALLHNFK